VSENLDYVFDVILASRIHTAASSALDDAKLAEFRSAINWGDLGVVDIRYWQALNGASGWEVLIEEASPDAVDLQEFVRERMSIEYGIDREIVIEIRTDW
jgi:hypothetical protein